MSIPSPPLVLIFGPFDPSGASNLPADAVTCAQLGGHALSVLTATHVQDTAGIEDIHPAGFDLIDDQARCLLEDMAVGAIKAGPLYTIESVTAVAQVAADYSPTPLVLHLGPLPDDDMTAGDHEDLARSICELLLPQTDLVVADQSLVAQWVDQGWLVAKNALPAAGSLLDYNAKWVLTTCSQQQSGHHYRLIGAGDEAYGWPWKPGAQRVAGAESALGCAIAMELARGRDMPRAVEAAIARVAAMTENLFQPGMGLRLFNRCST